MKKITTEQLTTVFTLVTIVLIAITLVTDDTLTKAITFMLSIIFALASFCGVVEILTNDKL